MKCPRCGKELICTENGISIYTNSKTNPTEQEMEDSYVFNGDYWMCDCGFRFVDGVSSELAKCGIIKMNEVGEVI